MLVVGYWDTEIAFVEVVVRFAWGRAEHSHCGGERVMSCCSYKDNRPCDAACSWGQARHWVTSSGYVDQARG